MGTGEGNGLVPALVIEDSLLVRYSTWSEWREAKVSEAARRADVPLVETGTVQCGHCWGQRRIFAPAANGEGLVPHPCPVCLGRGFRTTPAA